MEIVWRNGVQLPELDWWLDAHTKKAFSFVSHAHFDHMRCHGEVLCSETTGQIMTQRYGKAAAKTVFHILPWRERREFRGAEVALYPAGHVLGSAMLWLRAGGESLLFTGDFKLRPGRSCEVCEPVHADTLIMETTYGLPRYVMPPTEEVLAEIVGFCQGTIAAGETPVLFGYSLGKSQEILASLAEAGVPVMLQHHVYEITQTYARLGVQFPAYKRLELETLPGHVLICPPGSAQSRLLEKIGPHKTATVSGWNLDASARYRFRSDAAFALSDHADFPQLLELVERVAPKRVLTLHGFASEFATELRSRGVEAWSLTSHDQLELFRREQSA